MAKLTAKQRHNLPSSAYAGPHRSFPIPDKGHAEAAIRDTGIALKHHSITPAQASAIKAKAERKLRGGGLLKPQGN